MSSCNGKGKENSQATQEGCHSQEAKLLWKGGKGDARIQTWNTPQWFEEGSTGYIKKTSCNKDLFINHIQIAIALSEARGGKARKGKH